MLLELSNSRCDRAAVLHLLPPTKAAADGSALEAERADASQLSPLFLWQQAETDVRCF